MYTVIEPFNDWGGRECRKFVPVLRGGGIKIAPPGDIFDQPLGEMSWIRGKRVDRVEVQTLLSTEGAVLTTTSGTELSHPRPPQSLNDSIENGK